jgi:hypothetical protein
LDKGIDKVPAVFLGYEGEEIKDGVIVVWVGECDFSIGICRGKKILESTGKAVLVGLVGVICNTPKRTLHGQD